MKMNKFITLTRDDRNYVSINIDHVIRYSNIDPDRCLTDIKMTDDVVLHVKESPDLISHLIQKYYERTP